VVPEQIAYPTDAMGHLEDAVEQDDHTED